jgi:cysteine desulfurase
VLNAFVLGIAASCLQESLGAEKTSQIRKLTADFEKSLQERLGERITLNGTDSPRVPGTTHISLSGISGEGLIAALDLEGFAVSSGSACSSGTLEPSHVLLAMGISPELARASLRVSLPRHLPIAELEMALLSFVDALERVHSRMSRVPVRVASKPSQPGQHI